LSSVAHLVRQIIALRDCGVRLTLLAVCPNSDAVLEAAVQVAAANAMPLLLAATLNQVDRDGGYTGWTPHAFVGRAQELATQYKCTTPLYPCLDHGGPWLKDAHARAGLSLDQTMAEVKTSLTACLEAGYALLHLDPTVDRALPTGQPPEVGKVVSRTIELLAYAEAERQRLDLPAVSYEVGTEEVHGGLVDLANFDLFLAGLRYRLQDEGPAGAWPCFIVGKVGTDLHTTAFDPESARQLYARVAPLGSLIKGHYTDWVANPAAYPETGMGGANVGPEFTATELAALYELCAWEDRLRPRTGPSASSFPAALRAAVVNSDRWRKWLWPQEAGRHFTDLPPNRQEWLIATGARYVWTDRRVREARQQLYDNLRGEVDARAWVLDRIARNMQKYVDAFHLRGAQALLAG
jgi:D-tagatose-1,6-bisphosphate aldolase subunit GatZ/KbaZ